MKTGLSLAACGLLLAAMFSGNAFAATAQGGFQAAPPAAGGGFIANPSSVTTVKQALGMRDDAFVTLRGNIVQQVGKDNYLFQDSTGSIQLDIDSDKWRGQSVSPADLVEIQGEVDKDWNSMEIDVERVSKVQ